MVIQPKLNLAFLDGVALAPAPLNTQVCVHVCTSSYVWTYLDRQAGLEQKKPFHRTTFLNSLLPSAGRWLKDAGNIDGVARHSESSSLYTQRIK